MSRKTNFRSYTYSLTAGNEFPIAVAGNSFRVLDNSDDFTIKFDDSNVFKKQIAGRGAQFESDYERVTLLSATSQEVTVVLGFGYYDDSRTEVNLEAPNSIESVADVTVGVAATLILAGDTRREHALIHVPSTASNSIRVGDNAVTATRGVEVEPGQTATLQASDAIYGIRDGAVDVTVSVSTFGKI